jgi:hypothetical protein
MDRSAESSHENKRRPRRDDDLVEPLRNELALQSREERTPQHCDDPPQLRLNVFFVVVAMSLLASVDIRLLLLQRAKVRLILVDCPLRLLLVR